MRVKTVSQQYLSFEIPSSSNKVVRAYREKYAALNRLLLEVPEVLTLIHEDHCRWLSSSKKGRPGTYSSEEILRVLLVMFVEGLDYRGTVILIENSDFLRQFVGLGWGKSMMDFSFLAKAFAALSPETLVAMNEALAAYGLAQEKLSGDSLRTDTTAVETNIHYPTDSELLWDSYRVLSRTLKRVQQEETDLGLKHRFHMKKAKKLAHFIARNAKSTSKGTQRKVKSTFGILLERVGAVVAISKEVRARLGARCCEVAPELEQFEPLAEIVMQQTRRRVLEGEQVPACEKIFSIFEPHTELIIRGKAGKPVEFGHKVLLSQTREKFISHYRVLEGGEVDNELIDEILARHEAMFGCLPEVFAADKGFYKSMAELLELEKEIETVSICKKGRRTAAEEAREKTKAFKDGQCFRAGAEGSISVLKRAFKLSRCLFKGFKNYASAVGCAVFCHNLIVLART